ncbi:kinesin-like protein KIN-14E isoform X2 [Miscanthus floridulus]|uniref:kinesin-like protein KIN-14E isoform X2 n=1 Tax=Miscanthus floridulus TaxID=154761 RepID=UPI00345B2CC0
MRGNIRVFCWCRPLSKDETSSSKKSVVDFNGANDGEIMVTVTETTKKTFKFDRVFTPKDGQGVIYADVSPLVTSVLDGYNVCIFAYRQTGSGNTFTMEGTKRDRGVNYKSLEELFKIVNEREVTYKYDLSVSILEVYNEQIRDLLATPSSKNLEIKLDRDKSSHVPGITDAKVKDINEVWNILQTGSNARAVGSNNVNTHSSRSHCMIFIKVRAKNDLNGECTSSKLWLVDLAGSERLTKTDAQGEQLNEAKYINRSLSALRGVISALAMENSHIPYRNSKLTYLLQDSLGGNSKALMLVQISPSESDASETLMSLSFASCLRHIELGPAKKQVHSAQLQNTRQMKLSRKVRKLEKDLQNLKSKAKGDEQLCKDLQEKVKELEGRLDSKAHSQITSEKQQRLLSGKLKEKEQEHQPSIVEQKVTPIGFTIFDSAMWIVFCYCLFCQNKVLERKLKEQEHQRSA